MNKKTTIYGLAIIITLVFIGVGYAFLSSDLSLNGNVSVKKHEKDDGGDESSIVCKRATNLHEETCNSEDGNGCKAAGIAAGDKITYGSIGTKGTLKSGDAFDCDVNGDKEYNPSTERFYYLTDLASDNNYAVLIYYNNVSNGVPTNNASYAYDKSNTPRKNGPVTALSQLISSDTWPNVSLTNTTRKLKDEKGKEYIDFNYEGRATRLPAYNEIATACGSGNLTAKDYLNKCIYLAENTKYTDNSLLYGYWLEDLSASYASQVWRVSGYDRNLNVRNANSVGAKGYAVRPAIEVEKAKISY